MSAYHFVDSDHCRPPGAVPRIEYDLAIRQEPSRAKVCTNKEKERRPIDPPPIIQLKIKDDRQDPCHNYLQSPHLFVCVDLCSAEDSSPVQTSMSNPLAGTSVSSLYKLKDIDDTDGGFFVFGDLSVRIEGQFRLRFYLFEVQKGDVLFLKSITSEIFQVFSTKLFPGMLDSTFLSRSFSDQGVRIRIRKEHRIKMKRQPPRVLLSPDRHSVQYSNEPRPNSSHYPPAHSTGSNPSIHFESRPSEYHYPGAPMRSHVPRQFDYHPYQRSQFFMGNYYERPYSELGPSTYRAVLSYGMAGQPRPEYPMVEGSHTRMPSHNQMGEVMYHPEVHPVHPSPSGYYYGGYPERRPRSFGEPPEMQYPPELRPYHQRYPSDFNHYPFPPEDQTWHNMPPASHRSAAQTPSPRINPREEIPHRPDVRATRQDAPRPEDRTPRDESPTRESDRRASRHSLHAILSEESRRRSPLPDTRSNQDQGPGGRVVSEEVTVRQQNNSTINTQNSGRISSARATSSEEGRKENEPNQSIRSNSNLWKLVDAAIEQK